MITITVTLAALAVFAAMVISTAVAGSFLFGALLFFFRGGPPIPVAKKRLETMITLANIKPGELAIDLGSGDGRIVIAAAEAGAYAIGYELQPALVWYSRSKIRRKGLRHLAEIRLQSLWHADFSHANIVFVYGIPEMMPGLEEKLQRELRRGARVVSCVFRFPHWQPVETKNNILLYQKY